MAYGTNEMVALIDMSQSPRQMFLTLKKKGSVQMTWVSPMLKVWYRPRLMFVECHASYYHTRMGILSLGRIMLQKQLLTLCGK